MPAKRTPKQQKRKRKKCPACGRRYGASTVAFVDSKGYPRISLVGPLRDKRLHVVVMEAVLGRRLEPHEDVHHVNGDKLDFRPENLKLLDHAAHSALTNGSRRRVAQKKFSAGLIGTTGGLAYDRIADDDADADAAPF